MSKNLAVSKKVYLLFIIPVAVSAGNVQAQGLLSSDNSSLLSTVLLSAAFLVVTILAIVLLKRLGSSDRNTLPGQTGLNLLDLKKKGLLSPEETEKVSRAIRRQMELEQAAKQKVTATPTPDSLLLDPEVRRLEALAEAARRADAGNINNNEIEVNKQDIKVPEGRGIPGAEDDVELPPEVQQLADAGVLTPEEVENVRRRLRERQNP